MRRSYLFVCKYNFIRSKFAEDFFKVYLREKGISANVSSAGLSFFSIFLGKRINKKMLKNFDVVFVMEKYMKDCLVKKFGLEKDKIIVLNVKNKSFKKLPKKFEKIDWKKYV